MHTVKSLFLGSVVGCAVVSGAPAADLPFSKAAPVEYVRVCTTYGEGFFYIPGTEGCLRIGGRVRADYGYLETFTRSTDALGFRVRGRIQLDHRQATAYGLLRTFIRFDPFGDSGSFFGQTGTIGTTPEVAQGFIQFAGLTAGRTTSFFDNPDLPTTHMGTLRFSDVPDVNVLAYTYSFGNGFSATLSLEDPHDRNVLGFPIDLAPAFVFDTIPLAFTYGGTRMPDVIGNVRYVGEWGSVQLGGRRASDPRHGPKRLARSASGLRRHRLRLRRGPHGQREPALPRARRLGLARADLYGRRDRLCLGRLQPGGRNRCGTARPPPHGRLRRPVDGRSENHAGVLDCWRHHSQLDADGPLEPVRAPSPGSSSRALRARSCRWPFQAESQAPVSASTISTNSASEPTPSGRR